MCYNQIIKWRVESHRKGREEIELLPKKLRVKLERTLSLIKEHGPFYVHEPNVKHLQGKLWEIRLKSPDGIARVIYILAYNKRIFLLLTSCFC